jgi:isopenicillin N synthase-like dioxygenase
MLAIPSLNLHDFTRGDAAQRAHFVRSIGQAYEEVGFVAVSGHALSDALSDALYAEVRRFFSMDTEVKLAYEVAGLAGQRGYTSFGREHAKGRTAGDLKEFFQFGQEPDPSDSVFDEYPLNVRVVELPDFHRLAMEAYRALESSGRSILQAIALFLGLPERYFDAHIEAGNSILRAIHYGPISEEPRDAVRAAEHEDINLITLLMGASADGLEVLSREGNCPTQSGGGECGGYASAAHQQPAQIDNPSGGESSEGFVGYFALFNPLFPSSTLGDAPRLFARVRRRGTPAGVSAHNRRRIPG